MRVGQRGQDEILAGVAAELRRHPERVEYAETRLEFEEMLVIDGEQRTLQRRERGELVVWPFDRRQHGADRLDFIAAVERLPAYEQMGDPSRLDGVDVGTRHVFAKAREAPKQDRDVPRLEANALLPSVGVAFGHGPTAVFLREPRDERRDRIRQRLL